ncbi:MAG: phytanoyl-CoA dioxygenase family protein [Ferruginibacter sp.]
MPANVPLTESPFFKSELQNGKFSEEEKSLLTKYHDDGYLIISPKIDEALLDQVIIELAPVFNKLNLTGEKRLTDAWKYSDAVRQLATNVEIQNILKLLYQRTPIPFQTLNFPVGTQQKTHSDMIHFNSIPQRFMCGVWVALEDIHADNGPLHYYPGSNKLPFYDMIDIGVKGSKNTNYKKRNDELCKGL